MVNMIPLALAGRFNVYYLLRQYVQVEHHDFRLGRATAHWQAGSAQ